MIQQDSQHMDAILGEILQAVPEIILVIVIDRDGILISAQSRDGRPELNLSHQISALSGAMFEAALEQGSCVSLGSIEFQLTEYTDGYMIGRGVGNGLLMVFTQKNVQLGQIFQMLKEYQDLLCEIIDNYSCLDENEMTEDLRALFSSEFVKFE